MGSNSCGPGDGPGEDAGRERGDLTEAEVDELLRALADARCRYLLGYLASTDDRAVTVDDAAAYVATTTDTPPEDARVALYHQHLPRCDAVDVVEYDEAAGRVEYRQEPLVEAVLEAAAEATGTSY